MRSVILILIGLALGGFIRPAHIAWAQPPAPSGTVLTIAGNGSIGFSGDGGPATAASFRDPFGLAIGPDGAIYFADNANFRIRRIDPATGLIATIAGNGSVGDTGNGGPATNAAFAGVNAIAADQARNALYIGDIDNNWVRKVDLATGLLTVFAGQGNTGFGFSGDGGPAALAEFALVEGVATDGAGKLSIVDVLNGRIRRVDAITGIITTIAGNGGTVSAGDGGPATAASFATPTRVAADSAGNVFVLDLGDDSLVRRIDAVTGIITTVAGGGDNNPNSGSGPATGMEINYAVDLSVNNSGELFIASVGSSSGSNNQVFQVDLASGQLSVYAGAVAGGFSGDGGPAVSAQFSEPYGVTVTPAGEVIISDTGNQRIRYVVPESIKLVGSAQTALRLPWISSLSGDFIVTDNPNLAIVDAPFLTSVAGTVNVSGNASAVSAVSSLTTVGGDVIANNNTSATTVDFGNLTSAGGSVSVSGNTAATSIDLSTLGTTGDSVSVSGNTAATSIDLSALGNTGGSVSVSGNTAATGIDLSALGSTGGSVSVSGNTAATGIDLSALGNTGGSVSVSGNTAATGIDLSALGTTGGSVSVSGNTAATSIDLGSLATVTSGGSLSVSDNPSATNIILGPLTSVGGSVTIGGNSAALSINLGSLTTVGGSVNITNNTSATSVDLRALISTPAGASVTLTGNTSATGFELGALETAGGSVTITGNTAATGFDLGSLATAGGDVTITGNTSATGFELDSLTSTGGSVTITGNTSATGFDLGALASAGDNVTISGNTSATGFDLGALTSTGGSVTITGNTSAAGFELDSLSSTGGSVTITGNTSAAGLDLGALESTGGSVTITGNTSAAGLDLSALESTGGSVTITGNTSAAGLDLSALESTGGSVTITGNTSAAGLDLSALESTGGSVTITGNTSAAGLDLDALASVGGDLTVETAGSGTFDVGGADVEGDTSLSAEGYTEVAAATAAGETAVTMLNSEASMEVTLPDGAFSSTNPVTFSVEKLPGGDVETVDGEMVTQLESYAFDFAIPTLNSAAELNFEIDLVALDEPDRLSLVDLLHQSAELTIGVRGDAPGAELQLFDVCSGTGPTVDGCVVVQWLDATRMLLDPLAGLDPSILRFEALVGRFSTYSVVAVGLAGDYNLDGVVDAADYTVWRDTLGESGPDLAADGNNSGTIDAGDYDVWKSHFGAVSPGIGTGSGSGASHSAVPEPSSGILLLGSAAFWITRRRIRPSTVDRVYAASPAAF